MGDRTPGDGDRISEDGDRTPGDGDRIAEDGDRMPGDGDCIARDGDRTPGDGANRLARQRICGYVFNLRIIYG